MIAHRTASFLLRCVALGAITAFQPAYAYEILSAVSLQKVSISGNKRVSTDVIKRYAELDDDGGVTESQVNDGVKKLYRTGFFSDVRVLTKNNGIEMRVMENPSINQVMFKGNDKLESKKLEGEIQLRPRGIYTKPRIQEDVERILNLYRRSGRFAATVTPKIEPLDQNRVNVVFEITEGSVTRIGHIEFIGNKYFDDSTLKSVINTSTECWYCVMSENDTYDPDRVAYDQELLRRFYMNQGFADFTVKSVSSELSPENDAFFLTIVVDEGVRYTVNKVAFNSDIPDAQMKDLTKTIPFAQDQLYNASAVEDSIDKLIDDLGNKGFAFVNIEPELKRHENKTLDITYNVKEGERVYIERINIEGNVRTLDGVIRREFRLVEGDPYSTSKLQRSEQRLRNLGFFDDVSITTKRGRTPDRVVIDVAVKERSTGEVSVGAGFSTADGLLADFGVRERNLLGRGQDLRLRTMIATQREQFDVGFTEPHFLGRDVSAGFDLFRLTQDLRQESSFDRQSNGGRLRFGYGLTENLRQELYYSYLDNSVSNISPFASRFIRDQSGQNTTSLVGQSLILDMLDNRLTPTKGYLVRADLDFAGIGGDSQFIRPELRSAYYYTPYEQWTFMFAGSGGYVHALNDGIRIQDRFYLGGREIRGFNNAGIGPRDGTTRDALGGNAYYTATAELLFPLGLPEDLGFKGAVFTDIGSLFGIDETGSEVRDSSKPRGAAGLGIAWNSPFGPVRLDFARAFLKEQYDETQTFRIGFGSRF
ncbi:MAG: outer membrane protein assembly factor BamA [Alphaproteobacteria bacterium]|nr:MAG: outer membrane protein assembly factor BamA [Alphaproteobacteria bacterium]